MESTLYAIGLDPSRLPEKTNPNYCHVVAGENTQAPQHQSSTMALITGQAPPSFVQPRPKQQAAPPTGLLSGLPSPSASPTRTGYECPSVLTKAAGLTSSNRWKFVSKLLVRKLFLPWSITPETILIASGACGTSRMSSVKRRSSTSL